MEAESNAWREELETLVDPGIRFTNEAIGVSAHEFLTKESVFGSPESESAVAAEPESLKDQIKGFAMAWGEMIVELGRGCKDVVQQTLLTEDSYIVKKTRGPMAQISQKLSFLNEFLPEDRDPLHAWPVILFVFILALAVLNVSSKHDSPTPMVKNIRVHPPSAARILLPDGRYIAYHELGVPADKARFSLIAPHSFLSSRLAESDPHPNRNLNSSAMDMSYLADAVGVNGTFWVMGYSGGSLHAWAALKYIPDRVAGAAMFAPLVGPYESSMTKDEMTRTWKRWTRRRKLMYYLARRFPKFLGYFYRQTFLSGKHGQIDKWLSVSLGKKDMDLVKESAFEEIWHRDVEESIRQGSTKPFVEEAMLQASNWGFSLMDLQVQKKCSSRGLFPWLKFMYGEPECKLTGFLGPIYIWQGMDDMVIPPSMADYISRVLPSAVVQKLPEEGHFSYLFLCDECHRQIFSALFGDSQGPLENIEEAQENDSEEEIPDFS